MSLMAESQAIIWALTEPLLTHILTVGVSEIWSGIKFNESIFSPCKPAHIWLIFKTYKVFLQSNFEKWNPLLLLKGPKIRYFAIFFSYVCLSRNTSQKNVRFLSPCGQLDWGQPFSLLSTWHAITIQYNKQCNVVLKCNWNPRTNIAKLSKKSIYKRSFSASWKVYFVISSKILRPQFHGDALNMYFSYLSILCGTDFFNMCNSGGRRASVLKENITW